MSTPSEPDATRDVEQALVSINEIFALSSEQMAAFSAAIRKIVIDELVEQSRSGGHFHS